LFPQKRQKRTGNVEIHKQKSLLMKTITHSTSADLVYELKGVSFLNLESYGNTDTCRGEQQIMP
jgi:hypothetical protein